MRYVFYLLICNLLWAGNFVFGKVAVAEFSPVWITILRWGIAALVLFPLGFWLEKFPYKTLERKSWGLLALMGVLGMALFALLTYSALEYTSPINISLVNALTPGITMILSIVFLKHAVTKQQLIGIFLAGIGVMMIITHGDIHEILTLNFNKGDFIMLAGDFCWVAFTVLGKKLSHLPPITTTAISSIFGILFLLPFAWLQPLDIQRISFSGAGSIVYIGLGASVCAFVLWNAALREVDVATAGISLNLIPVCTVIIAVGIGYALDNIQLWGGAVVLLGMLFVSLRKTDTA